MLSSKKIKKTKNEEKIEKVEENEEEKNTEEKVNEENIEEKVKEENIEEKVKEEKSKKKKVKKETKKKVKENNESENDDPKKRYFKCYYDHNKILTDETDKTKLFGRFRGIRPRQAANKAFSSICKQLVKNKKTVIGKEIIFSIIECTRKGKNRMFNYIGKRESLENNFERNVISGGGDDNSRKIIYKYKNNIHKYKIPE